MSDFKQEWTLQSALEIVQHPTVDSQIWAEAVEWLMLYGPPEIKQVLTQASGTATKEKFPELKADRFAPDGTPCYTVAELAQALGISEEEAQAQILEVEAKSGIRQGFVDDDTKPLQ